MEKIKDFLHFDFFIAQDFLIVFYVLCAILIPIASWYFLLWAIRRYAEVIDISESVRYSLVISLITWLITRIKFFRDKVDEDFSWGSLSPGQKLKFVILFIFVVVFSEIILRLVFEYLIAYMHMHDWMNQYSLPK
jgi:hypothetical protein